MRHSDEREQVHGVEVKAIVPIAARCFIERAPARSVWRNRPAANMESEAAGDRQSRTDTDEISSRAGVAALLVLS